MQIQESNPTFAGCFTEPVGQQVSCTHASVTPARRGLQGSNKGSCKPIPITLCKHASHNGLTLPKESQKTDLTRTLHDRISCLIKIESSINKSAVPPQPPLFPLTHTHLHLRPLASFTTAVLSETIQSRSHMAEEDSAGQDGMVRATVEPQMRFSFYLPKCACLLSARLNTTDPTLLSWKTRQRRREGKGKRKKSKGGG